MFCLKKLEVATVIRGAKKVDEALAIEVRLGVSAVAFMDIMRRNVENLRRNKSRRPI